MVFFAIGFETTAPATAMTRGAGGARRVENFSLLVAHVLVPPAIEALVERAGQSGARLPRRGPCLHGHGLLAVRTDRSTAIGVPIVVTGFEPIDLLQGIFLCIRQLEAGRAEVENPYSRMVRREGNRTAQRSDARGVRGSHAALARNGRDRRKRSRA